MSSKPKVARAILVWEGKVLLLVRSMDDETRPGDWDLPGGGIEAADISLVHGIVREITEETGIVISPDALHEITMSDFIQDFTPFERHVFWCASPHGNVQIDTREHSSFKWVPANEVLRLFRHPFYSKAIEHMLQSEKP